MVNSSETILVFYGCAGGNGTENFVALVQENNVTHKTSLPGQGLAQALSSKTSELLVHLGDKKLDAIAVVTGPGSFTGLRSTIAIAQGLGLGCNVPVLGTSLFDAMRETLKGNSPFKEDGFVVFHHARKGYVYVLSAGKDIQVLSFDEALKLSPLFACGNAVDGDLAVPLIAKKYRQEGEVFHAHPDPCAIVRSCMANKDRSPVVLPVYGEGARISKAKTVKV